MKKRSRARKGKADEPPFMSHRMQAIARAYQRLGLTTDERCKWLLDDFTARHPDTLTPAERALWRENLTALVVGPRTAGTDRWVTLYEEDPLDEELPGLWERVVKLTGAHRESVALPALTGWVGRLTTKEPPTAVTPYVRLGRGYRAEDFEAALLHAVADLLIACQRLRECKECGRLFVASRRQERHKTCAQRARDRRRPSRAKKGA